MKLCDREITVAPGVVKVARLEEEWYEDVVDPEALVAALKQSGEDVDLFTFWQRLPDVTPAFSYHREGDEVAALPITSFDHWWSQQIKSRTRGIVRKASKSGLVVRETEYTDEFVRGMTEIFNETPVRQGRPFWHYGKSFETVKTQFARYLYRERLVGAYFEDQLVGFMMLGLADRYAVTSQIISRVSHRDKGTNNSLIAKAVEICAAEGLAYLAYLRWDSGSLSEFKRRNGFQRVSLPRYYIPLTMKGRLALRLGVQQGLVSLLPEGASSRLKKVRASWYQFAYGSRNR